MDVLSSIYMRVTSNALVIFFFQFSFFVVVICKQVPSFSQHLLSPNQRYAWGQGGSGVEIQLSLNFCPVGQTRKGADAV